MLHLALSVALLSSLAGANFITEESPVTMIEDAITKTYTTIKAARQRVLSEIDYAIRIYDTFRTRKLILDFLDNCEAINEITILDYVLEVYKYTSLTKGAEVRNNKMDDCYEQLRPRVQEAFEKGFIKPMREDLHFCENGFAAFDLGHQLGFATERVLPCGGETKPSDP